MKCLAGNKRGSLQDSIFIGVMLIVASIALIIGVTIYNNIDDMFQSSNDITKSGKDASTSIKNNLSTTIDNMMIILFIGLMIGAVSLAMLVRVHPIFIVPFFVLAGIVVFSAGAFNNIYAGIGNAPVFAQAANDLYWTTRIMEFLPFVIGVVAFIIAVVMFKTWQVDN